MPRKGTETTPPTTCFGMSLHLEMRCPGRGRKQYVDVITESQFEFGNEMPRKGTETHPMEGLEASSVLFGNEMPRKGTETSLRNATADCWADLEMRCPGRGRKQLLQLLITLSCFYLEMRCPGRGRKHSSARKSLFRFLSFGNEMPRKGTETDTQL